MYICIYHIYSHTDTVYKVSVSICLETSNANPKKNHQSFCFQIKCTYEDVVGKEKKCVRVHLYRVAQHLARSISLSISVRMCASCVYVHTQKNIAKHIQTRFMNI